MVTGYDARFVMQNICEFYSGSQQVGDEVNSAFFEPYSRVTEALSFVLV